MEDTIAAIATPYGEGGIGIIRISGEEAEKILDEVGRKFPRVITIENGVIKGGLGSAVLEWMTDHGYTPQVQRLGLPDKFIEHGTVKELQHIVGIDEEGILKAMSDWPLVKS